MSGKTLERFFAVQLTPCFSLSLGCHEQDGAVDFLSSAGTAQWDAQGAPARGWQLAGGHMPLGWRQLRLLEMRAGDPDSSERESEQA